MATDMTKERHTDMHVDNLFHYLIKRVFNERQFIKPMFISENLPNIQFKLAAIFDTKSCTHEKSIITS